VSSRAARAAAFALAAVGPACLMTIDEGRIPSPTTGTSDASDATSSADVTSKSGVRCGSATCAAPKPVCCVVNLGENDYRNGACDTAQDCQTGDYFHCTRPSECASGTSCCVVLAGSAFTRTECAATCAGSSICEPGGAPCPGGATCTQSAMLPGLYECK
jgi:hypothetical protein